MGTTFRFDYQASGVLAGTTTSTGKIERVTTFEGYSNALEDVTTTTATYTAPPELAAAGPVTVNAKTYFQRNGMELLSYGALIEGSYMGFASLTKTVNSPAGRDMRFTLSAGGSYQSSVTSTTTITVTGLPAPIPSQTTTTTSTVTYVGQEAVTVPAGTFTACKFQEVFASAPNAPTFQWISLGGVPVKYTELDEQQGTTTFELLGTSRVNGAPVTR